MLRCLASNNECQWDLLLSDVIISYNNASQSQLSMSPSKFILTTVYLLNLVSRSTVAWSPINYFESLNLDSPDWVAASLRQELMRESQVGLRVTYASAEGNWKSFDTVVALISSLYTDQISAGQIWLLFLSLLCLFMHLILVPFHFRVVVVMIFLNV